MKWKEISLSRELKFTGQVISVTVDTVSLWNGGNATREVVHHLGGAAMLAMDDLGRVTLVEQFRYPFGKVLLEIPAGRVEKGENPQDAAVRELREEAGLLAGEVISLGEFYPTCGYSDEIIYLYATKNCTPCKQDLDQDEFVDPKEMDLQDVLAEIDRGNIKDGKTIVACYKLQRLLEQGLF